jgi:hypothetical protein
MKPVSLGFRRTGSYKIETFSYEKDMRRFTQQHCVDDHSIDTFRSI